VQDLISQATHRAAGVIWLRVEVAGSGSQLPDGRALPRRRADVLYSPARFVENNLLTAVGAAEVLHRNLRIDEKPFPKADFSAMREAMLAQVPEEHRDRLKGAIRNDPTLRDRLHALAARPDKEAIAQLVPDVAHWARRTTRARNDLAHEGKTPTHSIEELIAIVDVTTAVVILNVLHELGLPAARQREVVRDHPTLRYTADLAREWLVASESH